MVELYSIYLERGDKTYKITLNSHRDVIAFINFIERNNTDFQYDFKIKFIDKEGD